uniref:Putative nucleic-acid-binding protein from transposon x-element n=1 Tax=Xenopsylla cheopis TaxID=163159 RepID=A0A6M2DS00_XENCH
MECSEITSESVTNELINSDSYKNKTYDITRSCPSREPITNDNVNLQLNNRIRNTSSMETQDITTIPPPIMPENHTIKSVPTVTWQTVPSAKKRKIVTQASTSINLQNRYLPLASTNTETVKTTETQVLKPPPLFIYNVTNINDMTNQFNNIIPHDHYYCRSLANNMLKIMCNNIDSYRTLIKHLKESNVIHHTYQLKEDRAYRVVLRNVHHTTDLTLIINELGQLGHKVRNIINIRHRTTKDPLNMFFVDLEPAKNNQQIFQITKLLNHIIKVEPPHKNNTIPQCTRCQLFNHTKKYCNRPFICVRCGDNHNSIDCKKNRDLPAKCGLCAGDHPANYRGCEYYKNFQRQRRIQFKQHNDAPSVPASQNPLFNINNNNPNPSSTNIYVPANNNNNSTYADVTKLNTDNATNSTFLATFLTDFKTMINQLMQQNTMIINMLSTLINKNN